ncbi:peptidase domain-containing ABC transporter [Micavibrio aeruginosavorus]|uniref:ABC transporter transmembrane region family protein n=1 Tax=Micavibrio aeruginosavorus (strain ARL-13) TaxID=856793 RepID=G2KRI1_MICAA|nr:ATP-binding cassette domain-containing protein [Micavibrio aeruginosavorus]AEP09543.1 ABC transporter transmembrane region family protein [Micavibrio aeruginosavorus ARL-13]
MTSASKITGMMAAPQRSKTRYSDINDGQIKSTSEIAALDGLMQRLQETTWSGQNRGVHQGAWERSLCMTLLAIDPDIKFHRIAESLSAPERQMDRVDFMNTMANLGFRASTFETSINNVDDRVKPCLFIPDGETETPFVVLQGSRIYDGEQHRMKDTNGKRGGMSGKAIKFTPYDESFEYTSKFMRKGTGHSWFRALLTRFSGTIWQIMATGIVLNLIALSTPLFIMMVYDRVVSAHALETLPMLTAGVMIAIAAEWMLRTIRSHGLSWLGGRLDNIVSNRIFEHLMNLSPSYIERAPIPSQVARIKTFESVRDFFSGSAFLSVLEMPFMLIALLAIAFIAGPLALVPVFMMALYAVLAYVTWQRVKVVIRLAAKASSARQQFALDTFDKLEDIRANGLQNIWMEKFRDLSGREAMAQFRLAWAGNIGETLGHAITILSAVAVVYFGTHLIWDGVMTTGALVASMILVWRVLTPFYSLCTMVPRLEQLRNSVRQINTLVDIDTEDQTNRNSARPGHMRGRVTFINAGLKYEQDQNPVFAGLTFDVKPGEICAITGENGAGKTSVLKLIKKMYIPQAGSIRIDGFDIRQLDYGDLRRNIAYVPQTPEFFYGSIADNIRFANPLATDKEINMALEQAGILGEVQNLHSGLNTKIGQGPDAISLPSAMAIRLGLVRAYLHEAPILLIDELPNSLLNDEAGQFLHETIIRAHGHQTVFMVTYRRDYLEMADTIVLLRRGLQPQAGAGPIMMERLKKMQW